MLCWAPSCGGAKGKRGGAVVKGEKAIWFWGPALARAAASVKPYPVGHGCREHPPCLCGKENWSKNQVDCTRYMRWNHGLALQSILNNAGYLFSCIFRVNHRNRSLTNTLLLFPTFPRVNSRILLFFTLKAKNHRDLSCKRPAVIFPPFFSFRIFDPEFSLRIVRLTPRLATMTPVFASLVDTHCREA